MSRLGTETAFKVLAQAQSLEANGVDVVHLEIGEPDFITPKYICEAATDALDKGYTHYCNSQGLLPLRTEIAKKYEKTYGISVDPECVVVTSGAKPIMFYSILALLEEGDEVIYPNPLFPIYESMINFTGAKAVPIQLREEQDFRFDIAELRAKVTPRTKLIIINSPHNPTGSVLETDDILAIADIAQKYGITILSDEIYENIIYEGKHNSIASLPGMLDRTILISGFSKAYAMTGWRLGYAVMPSELIDPVVRLIVNSVSCTAPFIQYAGIEALTGSQDSVRKMVDEFRKRRDLIVDGLNAIAGISCLRPKGAFYVFLNVKKLGTDCRQVANFLLNEAGVATLAGADFGMYGEGYIRLSYATSLENLKKGLDRIKAAVVKITA
ncbi:MAG: pyridoxal phosphate-dependent aminotransferase [Dehalococcoidales bacterium]|jgi:aspartate/methionine/tyrosine aminotransferase|nr:pyridoxal phosphate-dependent aminotransferase [Dehalococcoidales bacterium]